MLNAELRKRAIRNHEMRQGKSVMPLSVKPVSDDVTRVFDPETGGWSEWSHFGLARRGLYHKKNNPTGVKVSFYQERDPGAQSEADQRRYRIPGILEWRS